MIFILFVSSALSSLSRSSAVPYQIQLLNSPPLEYNSGFHWAPIHLFFILIDTIFYQYFAKLPLISILTRIWPFCYLVKVKIVRCWRVQPSFLEPWICQLSPRRRTDCYLFCIFTRPQRVRRTDGQHLLHLFHLLLTHLIFVTGTTREKSVMWRNFTFLFMTDVEKSQISPHVD